MAGENVFLDMEKNQEWFATWGMIVARSWAEPQFRERLLKASPVEFREICAQMGYDLPDHVDVFVQKAERDGSEEEFHYPSAHPEAVHNWRLPPTRVTLMLPPVPRDEKRRAMAIIDYLHAGMEYPFTTGC